MTFYRPHTRLTFDCGTEEITKQAHKAECDIHNILKQYQRTGIINHISSKSPLFTDLPSNLDYQSALNDLISAQAAFASLPSSVRDFYRNDPQRFLAALSDPAEHDRLRDLGILNPKPAPAAPAAKEGPSSSS